MQRFSHRSKSSEPQVRLLNLGIWHQKQKFPKHLALRPVGLECRSATGLGETDSTFREHIQGFTCIGTQGSDSIEAWARYICRSCRSLGEAGVSCGSLCGQCQWWQRPKGVFICASSPGCHHFGLDTWPYLTACRLQCWDAAAAAKSLQSCPTL